MSIFEILGISKNMNETKEEEIDERRALAHACGQNDRKKGDLERVKYLIEVCGKDPNGVPEDWAYANIPIAAAAWTGNFDIVKYLLEERKVDINKLGWYNWNALDFACIRGNPDVVRYLILHGADPRGSRCHRMGRGNPLNFAVSFERFEVIKILVDEVKVPVDVSALCITKNREIFEYLIDRIEDINSLTEYYRQSVLMRACENDEIWKVDILLGLDEE